LRVERFRDSGLRDTGLRVSVFQFFSVSWSFCHDHDDSGLRVEDLYPKP
jgi:hypothetical protein